MSAGADQITTREKATAGAPKRLTAGAWGCAGDHHGGGNFLPPAHNPYAPGVTKVVPAHPSHAPAVYLAPAHPSHAPAVSMYTRAGTEYYKSKKIISYLYSVVYNIV